jgi:small subunit ribosomal protein S2
MAGTTPVSKLGVQDLLDAGLHFGHQTKRWNPQMKPFIFDKRNGIHIIDLVQSLEKLKEAEAFLTDVVLSGRSVLFVGTKKQAQGVLKEAAEKCSMPYVVTRWLGGTLTNNATIRRRVKRLGELEAMEKDGSFDTFPKKEVAKMRHEMTKLQRNLGGIVGMNHLPGALFVVDINRESIAVQEANRLHIPVVAIADTNTNPENVDIIIPGNDDAIRAIRAVLEPLTASMAVAHAEWTKKAAEEAKRKAEEEAKRKAEEEARRKAEEAARQKADEEAKKKADEEKKKSAAEKTAKKKATKKAAEKKDDAPAAEKAAEAPAPEAAEEPAAEAAPAEAEAKID